MFKKGDPKYYGDMVTYMDKLIDRLLARLDELGLRNNTLVLFTGDNGSPVGEALLHDRKVRAGKGQVTDAGTHVPLIASWPVVIRRGTVCTDLVDFSDFLPTLCEAAGRKFPRNSSSTDGFPSQLRGQLGNPRSWCYCWYTKYPTQQGPRMGQNPALQAVSYRRVL